VNIKSVKF